MLTALPMIEEWSAAKSIVHVRRTPIEPTRKPAEVASGYTTASIAPQVAQLIPLKSASSSASAGMLRETIAG